MFNAALLSSPVDLSALVALSRDDPAAILGEVGLLNKMVEKCLNASEKSMKVDKDTRLDVSWFMMSSFGCLMPRRFLAQVLLILANLCKSDDEDSKEKVTRGDI